MRPSEILRAHRGMVLQIIAAHHANNPRVILEIAVLCREVDGLDAGRGRHDRR